MGKIVAIIQSNYIPWKGYFDIINQVDEFILLDDIQYTRRDWRNRNQIKTPSGLQWLTIPVSVKGKYHQNINETEISGEDWARSHWKSISLNYKKSRHFDFMAPHFENLYQGALPKLLSLVNYEFITLICRLLGIATKITWSSDYPKQEGKNNRIIQLCKYAGATEYLSGPSAKDYIDIKAFNDQNIKVKWMDYSGYSEYDQLHGDFIHGVSIVDLLFNQGENSKNLMLSFG